MVIADPTSELTSLVRQLGDPAPAEAPRHMRDRAQLIRRRFGLALPPPFAGPPGDDEPVRVAQPTDAAAIAAVKWRVFGTSYRGVLDDRFLDERDFVPPVAYWLGRAMVPPSRRHRLLVWGRPGRVFGYVECGPARPDEDEPVPEAAGEKGEIWELYVDPTAHARGGGTRLIEAAEEWLTAVGLSDMELSVLAPNHAAQAFYRARGWTPTGQVIPVDLGVVAFEELRFRRM